MPSFIPPIDMYTTTSRPDPANPADFTAASNIDIHPDRATSPPAPRCCSADVSAGRRTSNSRPATCHARLGSMPVDRSCLCFGLEASIAESERHRGKLTGPILDSGCSPLCKGELLGGPLRCTIMPVISIHSLHVGRARAIPIALSAPWLTGVS